MNVTTDGPPGHMMWHACRPDGPMYHSSSDFKDVRAAKADFELWYEFEYRLSGTLIDE